MYNVYTHVYHIYIYNMYIIVYICIYNGVGEKQIHSSESGQKARVEKWIQGYCCKKHANQRV